MPSFFPLSPTIEHHLLHLFEYDVGDAFWYPGSNGVAIFCRIVGISMHGRTREYLADFQEGSPRPNGHWEYSSPMRRRVHRHHLDQMSMM